MKGKWYAAPAISMVLLIASGLVACAPTTTSAPANSEKYEGAVPPTSTSPLDEPSEAETPANLELYYCGEPFSEDCFITLNTIKSLRGNGPIREYITVNQSPWIVNYDWRQTSNIGYECSVDIWEGKVGPHSYAQSAGGLGFPNHASKTLEDVYCVKVYKTGDFTIQVEASGCEWWVKVGVEPNTGAPSPDQKMIVGKWQHGISDCPPHVAKDYCEKIKKLPENELYYLEFFEDGQVNRLASGWSFSGGLTRFDGRYSLVDSKLEINWVLFGYEAYDIKKLSDDKMVLRDKMGVEQPFHRVD
jgi:hypothetical protein